MGGFSGGINGGVVLGYVGLFDGIKIVVVDIIIDVGGSGLMGDVIFNGKMVEVGG